MKKSKLLKLVLSALFLALAYVLPFLTGNITAVGSMLCPMHIPILLCGFICGWRWGLGVGFVAPLLRALTLGAPPPFPTALCMAFELAAYGAMTGILHKVFKRKKPLVICSLLISMICGRIIWGLAMFICVGGSEFTFYAFLGGAFLNAWPGIILQIVFIPPLVMLLDNPKILRLD